MGNFIDISIHRYHERESVAELIICKTNNWCLSNKIRWWRWNSSFLSLQLQAIIFFLREEEDRANIALLSNVVTWQSYKLWTHFCDLRSNAQHFEDMWLLTLRNNCDSSNAIHKSYYVKQENRQSNPSRTEGILSIYVLLPNVIIGLTFALLYTSTSTHVVDIKPHYTMPGLPAKTFVRIRINF